MITPPTDLALYPFWLRDWVHLKTWKTSSLQDQLSPKWKRPHLVILTPTLCPEVAGGTRQLEAWTGGLASLPLVSPSALSTGFLGLLGPVLVTEMQEGLLLAWCL